MKALTAARVSGRTSKWILGARALPLALGAMGSCLVGPLVHAQSANTPANPSASSGAPSAPNQTQQVEEIVVTAQRRTENIQNVPITITALTARDLTKAGISSTVELQSITPGLVTVESGSALLPYIRGVGSDQVAEGSDSSVATYIDGVYVAFKAANILELNDISSIEVLKGPQGTLFGRNATGGALNITTKDPGVEPAASFDVGYGSFNETSEHAYLSTPLTSTLGINFAATHDQDDGYIRDFTTGSEVGALNSTTANAKLVWKPISKFSLKFGLQYVESSDNATQDDHFVVGSNPVAPPGVAIPFGNFNTGLGTVTPIKVSEGTARLEMKYDLGLATLVSITGYQHGFETSGADEDQTAAPEEAVQAKAKNSTFSEEVQLVSDATKPFQWIVGGFYMNDRQEQEYVNIAVGLPLNPSPANFTAASEDLYFHPFVPTYSRAIFGQGSYSFTRRDRITVGLRYTEETKAYSNVLDAVFPNGAGGLASVVAGTGNGLKTFSVPTWRLSYDHHFSDDLMAYVSYNRGFKSGLFQNTVLGANQKAVNPEILDAFEVGLKDDLFDRRLRLNGSTFYYDYRDIQVSILAPGTGVTATQNAGAAEMYGLDLDATAVPIENLNIRTGVELLHSEYTNYPDASVFVQNPNGQGNLSETANATGDPTVYAPKVTFNLGGDYTLRAIPMGDRLVVAGNFYYNSGYDVQPSAAGSGDSHVNSFSTLNANITWFGKRDGLFVKVWGENLTDAIYPIYALPNNFGFGRANAKPTTAGVTVGVAF
jgi:iron complex outermembrane receptor protein